MGTTADPVDELRRHRDALILHLARERQWAILKNQRWGDHTDEPGIESRGACRDPERLALILSASDPEAEAERLAIQEFGGG